MKQQTLSVPEKKLVGISVRTSYANDLDPDTECDRSACAARYFEENIADKIPHLKDSYAIFCAYLDYGYGDERAYTYFVGQEVSKVDTLPEGLTAIMIPAQTYVKFTTNSGPVPQIIINAWQYIWRLSPAELGGERSWNVDFELFDERAENLEDAVIDVYIGIES